MSSVAPITITQPAKLAFGAGVAKQCAADLAARDVRSIFCVTSPHTKDAAIRLLGPAGALTTHLIDHEPTLADTRAAIAAARAVRPDAVVGFGGGSPLDVAKLVAAFTNNSQDVAAAFGINQLTGGRALWLACLPTTAGTGSEVSPNAIIHDEAANLKKGIISPALMPDAAYVDPELTLSVPAVVTASTGLDALTHCIEAYANKLAHPLIDLYALEGIRRVARSIVRAVEHGEDLAARTDVAMGSMLGGICLGPVNTGAVHALSYPMGSEFKIAHGVANALLLPHVISFNMPAATARYAEVAKALGDKGFGPDAAVARRGVDLLFDLVRRCKVPARLRDVGIPRDAFDRMARNALTITRLLDRNVRTVTYDDAIAIYEKAY